MHNLKRYCLRQPDGLFQLCVGGSAEITLRRQVCQLRMKYNCLLLLGVWLEETVLLPIDLVGINVPTCFVAGLS